MTDETTVPAAGILMDVLTRMEQPGFVEDVEAEQRPDGIRPPLWEVRYELNHALAATQPTTWLTELEHSIAHIMACPTAGSLRAALVHHAALTAAWIRDLDGREQ
jgi:hypothetical protein